MFSSSCLEGKELSRRKPELDVSPQPEELTKQEADILEKNCDVDVFRADDTSVILRSLPLIKGPSGPRIYRPREAAGQIY